ncbi:disease resistance protein RPM1-like [Mangifera indica]|uniref:disease resistance protein RPM1-like n=1 Tax=Mangifera indica TaxID=29780 RepID=UPI001CFBB4C3|nr:disease resistance protein RPM1-like [Mangifera indica]
MAEIAVKFSVETLSYLLVEEIELLGRAEPEVRDVKRELESIRAFLKDADARAAAEEEGESSEGELIWAKQVRAEAFRIEDVIDEFSFAVAKFNHGSGPLAVVRKVNRFLREQKLRRRIVKEIQDIKSSLAQIKRRAESYQQLRPMGQGSSSETTYGQHDSRVGSRFIKDNHVVGFDSRRKTLIDLLVKGTLERSVIAVVGEGGLGKTTLAGRVYHHHTVENHFEDNQVWITVGKESSKINLLRSIILKFSCPTTRKIKEMEEDDLIRTLRKHLENKRYMVMFDDVWPISFWQYVEQALPDDNTGSRIMITTRDMRITTGIRVLTIHQLEPLPLPKAMELLCRETFRGDGRCPPRLEKLSESIVEKFARLPLAIVAVGGILSTKEKTEYEWKKFLDGLGSKLGSDPFLNIRCTKILSYSYYDLPIRLKFCLLYFGLFPYNYSISCGRLMRLWIPEGFVQYVDNQTLEEVAEDYLIELIDRNLVQVVDRDISGRIRSCKVHALMYEIILQKSKGLDFCQVLREEHSSLHSSTTRRISINGSADGVTETIKGSKIRAVLLFDSLPNGYLTTFVRDFKLLKALDFKNSFVNNLPEAVGNLFHLHYLNLRCTTVKKLPKSIGKLVNLETLDLKLSGVEELPTEIKHLKKLRYLRASYAQLLTVDVIRYEGVTIQKGFGSLRDLRKLYFVQADTQVLQELKMLVKLRKLGITLTNGSGKNLSDLIENMENLESLIVDSASREEIIDIECMSSPPRYLQRLCLKGTMEKMPIWIHELEGLNRIDLDLSGLSEDPISILHSLPNLLELRLKDTYHYDHLQFKDGWFQKLQQLSLFNFGGLEVVTIDKGAMPDLRHLEIGPDPLLKITGLEHLEKLEGSISSRDFRSTVKEYYLEKVVIKLHFDCANEGRTLSETIVHSINGVMRAALLGGDGNILEVVGYRLDATKLLKRIRKKHGFAEIVSFGMVSGKEC